MSVPIKEIPRIRPVLNLQSDSLAHGLALAIFILAAGLASVAVSKAKLKLMGNPTHMLPAAMFVILIMCKSLGSILQGLVTFPIMLFMTPATRVLYPDEPLAEASTRFASSKDDCIPVVGREEPQHLLGVVRRRDVLRLQVRDQGAA